MFAIPLNILRNNCIKSLSYAKEVWNKVVEIFEHLPYILIFLTCVMFYNRAFTAAVGVRLKCHSVFAGKIMKIFEDAFSHFWQALYLYWL